MCLLEAIREHSATAIHCTARSHLAPDNPLRHGGRIDALAAIEYASQAIAAHCTLTAPPGSAVRRGYLVRLRSIELHVAALDEIDAPLDVRAEQLAATRDGASYTFEVSAADAPIARGSVLIALGDEASGAG